MADYSQPNGSVSFCPHCGAPLEVPVPRFCGQCGQSIEQEPVQAQDQRVQPQQSPQQTGAQVAQTAAAALDQATGMAKKAAAEVGRVLADPTIIGQIPGRSWSLVGAAAVAVLVLTGLLLSRFIGIFRNLGLIWSLVMLVGAVAVAAQEMRRAGMAVPGASHAPKQVQTALLHPLIAPVFAALTAVHAFQLAEIAIVPIAWILVAGLLIYDQWRKSVQAPNGLGRHLDIRLAWTGYRRYILIGALACLVAMWLTWADSPSHFTGAYQSTYSSYYGGYVRDWNATAYFWMGWSTSGRSMPFAELAVLGILAVILGSLYRGWRAITTPLRYVPLGVCAALFVWTWLNGERHVGPFLFLGGDLLIAGAWWMLLKGKDEGEFDLAHLIGRIRK